jgi:hypothetical protein
MDFYRKNYEKEKVAALKKVSDTSSILFMSQLNKLVTEADTEIPWETRMQHLHKIVKMDDTRKRLADADDLRTFYCAAVAMVEGNCRYNGECQESEKILPDTCNIIDGGKYKRKQTKVGKYESLTVVELRKICSKHKIKHSGLRKQELIDTLKSSKKVKFV